MFRPIVALLVLLGSPISIAHAQSEEEIDPATLGVLHDPTRLQLRISVVEADLLTTEQRLAALPDRTPWHATLGVGIALAAAGLAAEVVALVSLAFAELGSGLACGIDTLVMEPCRDPPTPPWIGWTAIGGGFGIGTGLLTLLVGVGQLHSIKNQETRLARRRDGRLRELDLLRAFELRATGDSIGIVATGWY